VIEAYSLI